MLVGVVTLAILAVSPLIASSLFDGDWFMVIALVAAFAAYAPAHMARGVCSGSGRFRDYAIVLGSDGIVRILLCVLLAVVGVTAAGAYGLAIAVSPLFAVAYVQRRGALRSDPGPPGAVERGHPESRLAAARFGVRRSAAQRRTDHRESALVRRRGRDSSPSSPTACCSLGFPLFLFQAVQAALLPRLSRLAARGEIAEFRSGLKRLMMIVLGVGVLGTLGAFVLGPLALRIVYDADLSGRTLAMLSASSACYMLALATAQAVIALRGHALVALGWGIGVVGFVLGTWLSSDEVFRRIEIGLLVSSLAALVAFAVALRHRLRSGATPDQGSVMEAITDMPFET